jgi:hypothetical protein
MDVDGALDRLEVVLVSRKFLAPKLVLNYGHRKTLDPRDRTRVLAFLCSEV